MTARLCVERGPGCTGTADGPKSYYCPQCRRAAKRRQARQTYRRRRGLPLLEQVPRLCGFCAERPVRSPRALFCATCQPIVRRMDHAARPDRRREAQEERLRLLTAAAHRELGALLEAPRVDTYRLRTIGAALMRCFSASVRREAA